MPNIAQAEFFESGLRLKTTVRFFDDTGALTRIALEAERLRQQHQKVRENFIDSTGLRRWRLDRHGRRLAGRVTKLKKKIRFLAATQLLCLTLRNSSEVAIERSDHSFRFVRADEMREVAEAAARSKSVWLFVFKPNDLLSDANSSIAYAM